MNITNPICCYAQRRSESGEQRCRLTSHALIHQARLRSADQAHYTTISQHPEINHDLSASLPQQ